ncbi:MAG: ATP-binding protein [Anaerolineales bacterium]|jgi:predicted AAA+ superfamily ATPase|nr:ATP-binding protein [Anaerolineales bacterium]MDX9935644.1 ATP-binding protein [Anaerolineales bacterium]GER78512.1 ATPase, AAA+ superfamily [Candidatus Denitrolinea symbiosum]
MSTSLFKRTAIDEISKYLHTDDIVVIHGARQVGKTSILMYLQEQLESAGERTYYIDLEDSRFVSTLDKGVDEFAAYLGEQGFDLSAFRQSGKKLFVLVDEIQYLANPSSFLKLLADHHRYLKIIVSGSSSFEMKSKFKDSLVGRTVNFEIHPLSFREFLLFRDVPFVPAERYTEKKTAELKSLFTEFAMYGGYPKIVLTPEIGMKERYLQQIIDTYIRKDIRDLAEIKDVNKFNRLLEVLASQSGNLLNVSELSATCSLSRETVERYLFLLEQTYIVRLVRPYSRNLRSELTRTPKIFFYDTGLMQMLWLKQLQKEVLGSVFETSIYAELIKAHGTDNVFYWRTQDKKEVDFILRSGKKVIPIEAKLSFPRNIPTGIHTWKESFGVKDHLIVGLNGTSEEVGFIYPWQLPE